MYCLVLLRAATVYAVPQKLKAGKWLQGTLHVCRWLENGYNKTTQILLRHLIHSPDKHFEWRDLRQAGVDYAHFVDTNHKNNMLTNVAITHGRWDAGLWAFGNCDPLVFRKTPPPPPPPIEGAVGPGIKPRPRGGGGLPPIQ